jgi:hypothetical protein
MKMHNESMPGLGKITKALLAAFFATLSAGCVPQPGGPSQTSAGPKGTGLISIEMTPDGNIVRATDANGAPIQFQKHPIIGPPIVAAPTPKVGQQYGRAMLAAPCSLDCNYGGMIGVCVWVPPGCTPG